MSMSKPDYCLKIRCRVIVLWISYNIFFTLVCQPSPKLHLMEQDVLSDFCKITEMRKNLLKFKFDISKQNLKRLFILKCFVNNLSLKFVLFLKSNTLRNNLVPKYQVA